MDQFQQRLDWWQVWQNLICVSETDGIREEMLLWWIRIILWNSDKTVLYWMILFEWLCSYDSRNELFFNFCSCLFSGLISTQLLMNCVDQFQLRLDSWPVWVILILVSETNLVQQDMLLWMNWRFLATVIRLYGIDDFLSMIVVWGFTKSKVLFFVLL